MSGLFGKMERRGVIDEIFKPARRNYDRLHEVVKGINETLSADLVDMQKDAEFNGDHTFILTVIDNFSKRAWAEPLKNKTEPVVTTAMTKVLKEAPGVKKIFVDEGGEFFNHHMQKLLKKHKIKLYHTYLGIKSPIIERFNRTLRHMMEPELLDQGNRKWLELLRRLIDRYNHKKHTTIKMAPASVTKADEQRLLREVYGKIKVVKRPKFRVGDRVRISKVKRLFEKGYTPNWTFDIYTIYQVKLSNPRTYLLKDHKGKKLKEDFMKLSLEKPSGPTLTSLKKL